MKLNEGYIKTIEEWQQSQREQTYDDDYYETEDSEDE